MYVSKTTGCGCYAQPDHSKGFVKYPIKKADVDKKLASGIWKPYGSSSEYTMYLKVEK